MVHAICAICLQIYAAILRRLRLTYDIASRQRINDILTMRGAQHLQKRLGQHAFKILYQGIVPCMM